MPARPAAAATIQRQQRARRSRSSVLARGILDSYRKQQGIQQVDLGSVSSVSSVSSSDEVRFRCGGRC